MDTIHHRFPVFTPSPFSFPANLCDKTNCQNERLFSRGIGLFIKAMSKMSGKKAPQQSSLVISA